jgi:biopolymer transport protein ExbD
MFDSIQKQHSDGNTPAGINIAPLIDMMFILLIFFLVTTTFVEDTGLALVRPESTQSAPLDPEAMRISITAGGRIFHQGDLVTRQELFTRIRQWIGTGDHSAVVIIPDAQVPAGRLVDVMDTAKEAGASDIALATKPSTESRYR